MKIYNLPPSEGLRILIGYQCNECELTEKGEDLPEDWIETETGHYCLECQNVCIGCCKKFSIHYSRDWFKHELCEDCQEESKFEGGYIK